MSEQRYRNWRLYVLELENSNYYIGITTNLSRRNFQHFGKGGAKWTQKHKPIKVLQTKELGYMGESDAAEYETYVTYLYIKKYGLDNVRGGNYCTVEPLVGKYRDRKMKDYRKRYDML